MSNLFKPGGKLLALFVFLPVTPSIAAITVFTQSMMNDRLQVISIRTSDTLSVLKDSKD